MSKIKLKCGCCFEYHKEWDVWELLEACLDDSEQIDKVLGYEANL